MMEPEKEVAPLLEKHLVRNAYNLLIGSGWDKGIVLSYLRKFVYSELPLMIVEDLKVALDNREILSGVSFEVLEKEIVGIVGVSGSGKTTLLRSLVNFLPPDKGKITIKVGDKKTYVGLHSHPIQIKTRFGFSSQTPAFYPQLSVLKNLMHFCSLYGYDFRESEKRADELLELTGLKKFREYRAGELSIGMQKKLDIACATIHHPEILILDEPTADLDPVSKKEIWDMVRALNSKGTTIILASHFLDDLGSICSKLMFLDNGRIALKATPEEFVSLYSKKMQVWIKTNNQQYNILSLLFRRHSIEDDWFTFLTDDIHRDLHKIQGKLSQNGDYVTEFKYTNPSLKEIFQNLVSQNAEYIKTY